jgi:sortase (surface protein transpeptidase)
VKLSGSVFGMRRSAAALVVAAAALSALAVYAVGTMGGSRPAVGVPANARVPAAQAQQLQARFATPTAPVTATPAAPTTPTAAIAAQGPPVEVVIPAIGVRSTLVRLHLNPDGTLQVPTDVTRAGWYSDGPAPGDGGTSVIVGHVDSVRGPAIFYRLPALRIGDVILTRAADGAVTRFAVYKLARYGKTAFPANQVYTATGRAELRLITCTGVFDRATGHYLSNLVVYAVEQGGAPGSTKPVG